MEQRLTSPIFIPALVLGCLSGLLASGYIAGLGMLIPVMGMLAPIPLFILALRFPWQATAFAAIVALGIIGVFAVFLNETATFLNNPITPTYALHHALPAVLLALCLPQLGLKNSTPAHALLFLNRLTLAGLLVSIYTVYFFHSHTEISDFFRQQLLEFFEKTNQTPPENPEKLLNFVPGIQNAAWYLQVIFYVLIAQWHINRQHTEADKKRFLPPISLWRFTHWHSYGAVILMAACYLLPESLYIYALGMLITLAAPLLLTGLAVCHGFAKQKQQRSLLLTLLYTLCFIYMPILVAIIALGIADTFFDFRKNFKNSGA